MKKGIRVPAKINPDTGYRYYNADQVQTLDALLELKVLSFSFIERISKSKEATKLQELTDEQRAWLLVKMVCVEDLHGQSMLSEALWL